MKNVIEKELKYWEAKSGRILIGKDRNPIQYHVIIEGKPTVERYISKRGILWIGESMNQLSQGDNLRITIDTGLKEIKIEKVVAENPSIGNS